MQITHYVGKYALYRFMVLDHEKRVVNPSTATHIAFTVKQTLGDADIDIKFERTVGSGISLTEADGITYIDVEIDAGTPYQTKTLGVGNYVYDLQIVTATGKNKVLASGLFVLQWPVKRDTPGATP